MAAATQVQGIAPGSLNAGAIHRKVTEELGKVKEIGDQLGAPTIAINKVPDKTARKKLEVEAGSRFNVTGKNAELIELGAQIAQAVKIAGKTLAKNAKAVLEAKAKILKAVGEIEVAIASGKSSLDVAFKKRADVIIQQSLVIADKGGFEDTSIALENIQLLEQFQNVPSVAMALAKHGVKITGLKSQASNPALAPFLNKAASGGNTPSDLAAKNRKFNPADMAPQYQNAA